MAVVAGNHVAGTGGAPLGLDGPEADEDTVLSVAEGGGATRPGTDSVFLGVVGPGVFGKDADAVAAVCGDHIPSAGNSAADGVVVRSLIGDHAIVSVGHGDGAEVVGANQVALDDVRGGAQVSDEHSMAAIARNHIAANECCAANRVTAGAASDE